MKKKREKLLILTLCSCFYFCNCLKATADVVSSSAGAVQSEIQQQLIDDKINKKMLEQDPDFKVEINRDKPRQVKPTKKDNENEIYDPGFILKKVIFEGNTIYDDEDLSALAVYLIGKEVHMEDIVNLTTAITKKYSYNGYITSLAYTPEQDVVDGTIKIVVVESKVKDINITGNKWTRTQYFTYGLANPSGLKEDKVFNVKNLDTMMKEIKNTSYLKGNIAVSRGKNLDETVIDLKAQDRLPLTFNVAWDDHGRRLVGEQRARMLLTNENLTGFGDKLYGGVVLASGTTGVLTGYQIPISKWGTKLAFDYGYTNVRMGKELSDLQMTGKSKSFLLRLIQPVYKSPKTNVEASVGIDFSNTNSNLGIINLPMSDYSLRVIRGAVYGTHDDKSGRTFASVNTDFGINGLGATQNSDGSPDSAFSKFAANLIRLQKIPLKDSYLVMRIGGQYSPNPLYPIEQMQLGGYNSVRGYETGTLIADYGVNGSFELRTPIPGFKKALPTKYKHISDNIKLLTFYDFGYVKEHNDVYNYSKNFLHSVGAGVNIYTDKGISINIAVGIPIGTSEYNNGSARLHFALSTDIDRLLYRRFYKESI